MDTNRENPRTGSSSRRASSNRPSSQAGSQASSRGYGRSDGRYASQYGSSQGGSRQGGSYSQGGAGQRGASSQGGHAQRGTYSQGGAGGAGGAYGSHGTGQQASRTQRSGASRASRQPSSQGYQPSQGAYQGQQGRARTQASSPRAQASSRQRDRAIVQSGAYAPAVAGAGQYSRNSSAYASPKKKGGKLKIVIIIVLVAIIAACAGVFLYLNSIQSKMQAGVTQELRETLVQSDYTKEPFYMLLMGVDSSEERGSSDYDTEGARSDSMMLVRVDCPNKKVTMVSLHRDTEVDMGSFGVQKLNAAHSLGGSAMAVQAVSTLAGVDISHYAELNFDAFRDMVDAVGGIEVDVPMEIDDELAGGYVAAGLQTLDGEHALILCRARHAYDDYGDGDVYRAANQRLVLGALAKKILSSDVATIANTVSALAGYVTTDLSVTDIIGIAQSLKGLDPSTDIYSAMEPTAGKLVDGIWYEVLDETEWNNMMTRMKAGLSPKEEDYVDSTGTVLSSAGTGTISVLNNSGGSGDAADSAHTIGADGSGYCSGGA